MSLHPAESAGTAVFLDDDDIRPISLLKPLMSLDELHARISELQAQASRHAEAEAARVAHEDRDHPEPPTLDPALKTRARAVWARMRARGLWHAPWHHEEIWCWAGSTEDGQAWLAKEVAYWEGEVARLELLQRLTMIRLCEEGHTLSDGTSLRTLGRVLKRERGDVPAKASGRAPLKPRVRKPKPR